MKLMMHQGTVSVVQHADCVCSSKQQSWIGVRESRSCRRYRGNVLYSCKKEVQIECMFGGFVGCPKGAQLGHVIRGSNVLVRSAPRDEDGSNEQRSSQSSPSIEGGMTLDEAYGVLGLGTSASYDEVLARKGRLLEQCQGRGDEAQERAMLIEIAYDTIFSSRLKARLSGDLDVSSSVRFADVRRQKAPAATAISKIQEKVTIPSVPNDLLTINQLNRDEDVALVSGVFGVLLIWSLVQGVSAGGPSAQADIPSLQIALGVASVVYFQREKKRSTLPKSVLIATVGLIAGTIAGAMLENWLRVDIIPLFGLSSPGTVVGSFSLVGLYLSLLLLA
jgi:hypothetical protein